MGGCGHAGMRAHSGARSRAGRVPSGRGGRNAPAPSMAGQEDPRGEVGLDVPTWPEVLAREASHHFVTAQMVHRPAAQIMSMQKWVAMSRFEQRRARAGDAGAGSPFPARIDAAATQNPAFIAVASKFTSAGGDGYAVEDGPGARLRQQQPAPSPSRPARGRPHRGVAHRGVFFNALGADDGLRGATTCSGYGHCQVP